MHTAWSVCPSNSLTVTAVCCTKMAKLIEMPFGMSARVDPRNHMSDRGPNTQERVSFQGNEQIFQVTNDVGIFSVLATPHEAACYRITLWINLVYFLSEFSILDLFVDFGAIYFCLFTQLFYLLLFLYSFFLIY